MNGCLYIIKQKEKEQCCSYCNCQLADIVGLELLIDCWSHVKLWMCLVINVVT